MLFLLNDVVFQLEGVAMDARLDGGKWRALALPAVLEMGKELFAAQPLLQRRAPERARRLAALISAKAPAINAALFLAPSVACLPEEVTVRFASCQFEVMAQLASMQKEGGLDAVSADNKLWRRLAA